MPALIVPLLSRFNIATFDQRLVLFCPHNAASGRSDGEEVVRESYLSGVVFGAFPPFGQIIVDFIRY
jgi:hypothetical protein